MQFGWNAGPRHARVFGLAKSFTKDLDDETKISHDTDIIAAMNLVWGVGTTMGVGLGGRFSQSPSSRP